MYVIIDNYDSFTYNIVQLLGSLTDSPVNVYRNDQVTIEQLEKLPLEGIIISPGPGRPEDAGISLDVIRYFHRTIPILGVCLGHQVIVEAFGGKIVSAKRIMHGKTDTIEHDGKGVFRSLKAGLCCTRYHSLAAQEGSFSDWLEVTARSSDGEIMGVRHREYCVEGVQFHPESLFSEQGELLLGNFLNYKREPFAYRQILKKLLDRQDLLSQEAYDFVDELTDGRLSDARIAGMLTAMAAKGYTETEIAACVQVLKDKGRLVRRVEGSLDTCGTGGDGLGTFNISSMAALLCSAAGVPVAKHGNRAVSSHSGSADFYESLGLRIDLCPEEARHSLESLGFTFLFAPLYHSAMRFAAPARRALGIKTIMNVIGPLANPADVDYQLIGVYDPFLLLPMARAARLLGRKRVMTVCGHSGEDEISVTSDTAYCLIDETGTEELGTLSPGEFGIPCYRIEELVCGSVEDHVKVATAIAGAQAEQSSYAIRDAVILNAAAALFIARKSESIAEAVTLCREVLAEGRVARLLEDLRAERTQEERR